ncbi:hypothetical protein HYH03_018266 [Edaphochlamys debaryana]|uniref:non-specific serine/threonine protein kinase n=1 Tax=Edaphochlamys debaryana TaxID=47281 RepID=A0A836BPK4_9CHLO|nr:hypothetical protein HYH03_018266 [Edaphochlamys debaryana]|eukprot:KAG2482829.1 hypothetical protein HYH03_018266 [Edaphochlamys debaryana]
MSAEENRESAYDVRETIGKGAFGEVLLAVDKATKARYVLKRIKMARQSEWQRNSTRQEIEIVSRLRHPFIVPYREHWLHHGHTINVVYGYCEKGDLTTAITKQRGKPFTEEQLRLWLAQLLLAVDYMHGQAVLHRDIKPQNILLTGDMDVQIGDFGLSTVRETGGVDPANPSTGDDAAAAADGAHANGEGLSVGQVHAGHGHVNSPHPHPLNGSPDPYALGLANAHHAFGHANHHAPAAPHSPPAAAATPPPAGVGAGAGANKENAQADKDQAATGAAVPSGTTPAHDPKAGTRNDYALVGTPHFMSPELLSNQKYSYETDIWSLGVVMYELTTLKPPFNAFNLAGLVAKIKRAAPPPIPSCYSADWGALLKGMLRKDPGRRATALDILSVPSMAAAVAQAKERARAIYPDIVLPDIPAPKPAADPTVAAANGPTSAGIDAGVEDAAEAGDFAFNSVAAAGPTPVGVMAAATPILARPNEPAGTPGDGGAGTDVEASPMSRFPDLDAPSPLPAKPMPAAAASPPAPAATAAAPAVAASPSAVAAAAAPAAAAAAPAATAAAAAPRAGARVSAAGAPAGDAMRSKTMPTRRTATGVTPAAGAAAARPHPTPTGGRQTAAAPAAAAATGPAARSRTPVRSSTMGGTAAGASSLPRKATLPREAVRTRPAAAGAAAKPAEAAAAAGDAGVSPSEAPAAPAAPAARVPAPRVSAPGTRTLPPMARSASASAAARKPPAPAPASATERGERADRGSGSPSPLGVSVAVPELPSGSDAAGNGGATPSETSAADTGSRTPPGSTPARSPGTSTAAAPTAARTTAQPRTARATSFTQGRTTARAAPGVSPPGPGTGTGTSAAPAAGIKRAATLDGGAPASTRARVNTSPGRAAAVARRPATLLAGTGAATTRDGRDATAGATGAAADGAARPARGRRLSYVAAGKPPPAAADGLASKRVSASGAAAGPSSAAAAAKDAAAAASKAAATAAAAVTAAAEADAAFGSSAGISAGGSSTCSVPAAPAAALAPGVVAAAHAAVAEAAASPGGAGVGPGWSAGGAAPSRSIVSLATEDSELSLPDGRYAASEVSAGGALDPETGLPLVPAPGVPARPAPGPVTALHQPLWSSNQLYSGTPNMSDAGGPPDLTQQQPQPAAAAGSAGVAVLPSAVARAAEPLVSGGGSGAISGDLPRRVSVSAFGTILTNAAAALAQAESSAPGGAATGSPASTANSSAAGTSGARGARRSLSSRNAGGVDSEGAPLPGGADSPATMSSASATGSSVSVFTPSPARASAEGGAAAAAARRRQASAISQRQSARRAGHGLRASRDTDGSGGGAGSGARPLAGEPSFGSPSTASAQRSFAGFAIHQPPSPSHWPANGTAGATASPGNSVSAASSGDATSPLRSPLRPVEEAPDVSEDEAQSAPSGAAAAGGGAALSGTEREQLALLQRVVSLAASLVEQGGGEGLAAVLSSTLRRPLTWKAAPAGTPQMGSRVAVTAGALRGAEGVARYVGPCHWGTGRVVGIELPPSDSEASSGAAEPSAHESVVARDGVTYFRMQGPPGSRGVFVPLDSVAQRAA